MALLSVHLWEEGVSLSEAQLPSSWRAEERSRKAGWGRKGMLLWLTRDALPPLPQGCGGWVHNTASLTGERDTGTLPLVPLSRGEPVYLA
jgi:hypothetical protein